jgi:hypothetical protein
MDFVNLANGHRYLLQRVLDGDDDFAKIEYTNDKNIMLISQQQQASGYYDTTSTPILSKSAEAELYLLATNFLLCTYKLF